MKKKLVPVIIFAVLLTFGCGTGNEKTEIRVRLAEPGFIHYLSDYTNDSIFLEAFTYARNNHDPAKEEFVSVFTGKLAEIWPDYRLDSWFYTQDLHTKIEYEADNQKYVELIRSETAAAKEQTVEVLKGRLQKAGIQPGKSGGRIIASATATGKPDEWLLTVNRKIDSGQIKKILETAVRFDVYETWRLPEIWEYIIRIDDLLKDPAIAERLGIDEATPQFDPENPMFRYLQPDITGAGEPGSDCTIGYARIADTALVNRIFSLDELLWFMPRDLKVVWDCRPDAENGDVIRLVAVKPDVRNRRSNITENVFLKAKIAKGNNGWFVDVSLDPVSAGRIWANLTAYNLGLQLAFTMNGAVLSTPLINDKIISNTLRIDGLTTIEEASDLAILLGSGYMPPVEVKVVEVK